MSRAWGTCAWEAKVYLYVKAVDPVNLNAPGYINCAHRIGQLKSIGGKEGPGSVQVDTVEERCAGRVDLDLRRVDDKQIFHKIDNPGESLLQT